MRIFFMGNNWVGWQALAHLVDLGEEIVGLAVHPRESGKFRSEIIETANLVPERVFDGAALHRQESIDRVQSLSPDIALSIVFGYIVPEEFTSLFPRGVINLHSAFLPYNRGGYPNVWSIVDQTPAGVSLHYIDAGIDTGDIIARREVAVEPIDTGGSLYRKLERASVTLFEETWLDIKEGVVSRTRQTAYGEHTAHRTTDVNAIDRIDLDRTYTARELIAILRARTFPPHKGAYFIENERRVNIAIKLEYDESGDIQKEKTR